MGDLRLFGFISLACVSMLLVQAWQQDYGQAEKPATAIENAANTTQQKAANLVEEPALTPGKQSSTVTESSNPVALVKADENVAASPSPVANTLSIENAVLRIKINTKGGDIIHSELLQYGETLEDSTPITLLNETPRHFFEARKYIVFQLDGSSASSEKFIYKVAEKTDQQVKLYWESKTAPGLRLEKDIAFDADTYRIKVTDRIVNNTNGFYRIKNQRELVRVYNEDDHKQGFTQTFTGGVFYNPDVKYDKYSMSELSKGELEKKSDKAWAAMIQHYFGTAWVPAAEQTNTYYSDGDNNDAGYRYTIGFNSEVQEVKAGNTLSTSTTLFVGPKIEKFLQETAEGLDYIVDYGIFTPISQPLFTALNFIHGYVGNWGWAIILLTFVIKLIFFYPSQISYKSMAKMREAQPKMQAIRDRYADDRQRQGQAMMELYKKEKINPAAGCLPMLIQVPVFISLYWALLESVELRHAPWALWIQDLSAKDPFYILPLIMGVTMFIQQKLNPQPTDPIQAKVFTYLPVVFTVFFMFFPAGLVLYWITNNILTITQQWYIYKFVVKRK